MAVKSRPSARPQGKVPPRSRAVKSKRQQTKREQLATQVAKRAASLSAAEDRLTEAVRAGVAHALREPGTVVSQLFETAATHTQEAIAAARSVGADIMFSARSVTRGVLLGVSDAGGDVIASASHVVRSAVNVAADAGNEATAVGWRALRGVVDAAQTVGADAAAAARGAVEAVSDTVLSAGETATEFVDRLIKTATMHPQYAPAKAGPRAARARATVVRRKARKRKGSA